MKHVLILSVIFIFLSTSCTFDECTSKSLYIVSFEKFIDKVNDEYKNYTEEDWKKADERFKKLSDECYKKFEKDLSVEDKSKLLKYGVKYTYYRVATNFPVDLKEEDLDEFAEKFGKLVEKGDDISKLLEDISKDENFRKSIEDFNKAFERLGKGLDNLGKSLEKLGKGLDKIFEDYKQDDN